MRAVVVGASSGLGRCIAVGLGQRGAQVALLARRKDRIEEAAKEAGPDSLAITCDVTDETSVATAIEQAAAGLGGIDALVYASGIGDLHRIEDADIATWHRALDTNVIGASIVTAAALPHLRASSGSAAYLSSTSSSLTPPWPGLGVYAVSKAALNKMVEAWRNEHPDVGFTQVTVGECGGGEGDAGVEFNSHWDHELIGEVAPIWINRQYMAGALLEVEELVRVLDNVLRCGASASIPHVAVVPRPPAPAPAP
jgi:NAD(P)-dependent dehydrogenase (short-subunit alcohol dehydrogenase family)